MYVICLSHDIDALEHPYSSLRGLLRSAGHRGTWRLLLDYLSRKPSARSNPYDTFDKILDLERLYKAKSTFFAPPVNNVANISYVRRVRDSGWEVGLHGISGSHLSACKVVEQKEILEEILGSKISGIRQHRLDLMIPRTFEFERAAGFSYDSSYFPPRYGRERMYCPLTVVEGLIEIPLAFMDSDFSEMTLTNGIERTWKRIERILEEYRQNEGVCTVLWHPHAFYDEKNDFHKAYYRHFKGFAELYEKILEYGSKNSDKMCGCLEVARSPRTPKKSMW
jgi:peptidoglycan/xylan/chitin deacetylase (PgdA/CDA1 family)